MYPRIINPRYSYFSGRTRFRQGIPRERIDERNPELAENGYNGDAAADLASPRLTDKEEGWFLSEMGFRPTDSRAVPFRRRNLTYSRFSRFSRATREDSPGRRRRFGWWDGPTLIIYIGGSRRFDRRVGAIKGARRSLAAIQPGTVHPRFWSFFQRVHRTAFEYGHRARERHRPGCWATLERTMFSLKHSCSKSAKWSRRNIYLQ